MGNFEDRKILALTWIYVGFRSADNLHRVDLKTGTKPITIFIPGPFGMRKGPRAIYNLDFKTKNK